MVGGALMDDCRHWWTVVDDEVDICGSISRVLPSQALLLRAGWEERGQPHGHAALLGKLPGVRWADQVGCVMWWWQPG